MDATRFAPRKRFVWRTGTRALELGDRTIVMGVLNITPDSFSDGGKFTRAQDAVLEGLRMLDDGAEILDIGGESTRPGSIPVDAEEELARVLPVIEGLRRERPQAVLSVDTSKAAVAREGVAAGAEIVNDVSGLTWDAGMARACAELGCGVVVMHTRGRPSEWRDLPPMPPKVLPQLVHAGLARQLDAAQTAGITDDRIAVDPGFGFGKMGEENYALLADLAELNSLGFPIVAGISRKSFLGRTVADRFGMEDAVPSTQREDASLAAATALALAGAHVVRVHNVREAVEAVAVADAILRAA